MTIKERIEIKLKLAQENLKKANEEYYKLGKENKPLAEGEAYVRVRYCQGVIETCKFTLELLEKGD
ncbi:hypothetical protein [Fusobacterium hwasookii]|uniref:hypothetical protein n=1 Tax=Fusobacterium hwasookii TaxID=1583098 RepID=UPI0028EB007E|nr:hypothetical protein [Fusobacterium hwasookii]